jgi:acetylornithine deacetylase/succinyl-diaminopimelate desuccinylase-like protein
MLLPHRYPPAPQAFLDSASTRRDQVIDNARALIAIPSPNPPLATGAVAAAAANLLSRQVLDVELSLHETGEGVVNIVARVKGSGPGRRLVMNGHLDTYPVNESLPWTVDPLGGLIRDDRLSGRGAADMKGGIAASMTALALLAEHRALWRGEAVLALAGDEESMGGRGTQWLIDNVEHATGDAVIIGDAGSPLVLRFGEKGFLWVELEVSGKPAHGAHVHLGINAIDRLRQALDAISALTSMPVHAPEVVTQAIAVARVVSEPLGGPGESETLGRVTVNIGHVVGGTSMNLIPASARAGIDIRLPVGVQAADVEGRLAAALAPIPGVTWRIVRRFEPNFTSPDAEIVRSVTAAATHVLGRPPAVNMRVGGSDSRLYRMAGIPTVVYGPTPYNMGGADEYALVAELHTVAMVHALAALNFLSVV